METPDTLATEIRNRIHNKKSHVSAFFRSGCDFLSTHKKFIPSFLKALEKLAYSSEFLYIDIQRLFPIIFQRKEFILFADLLYSVSSLQYEYGGVLLSYYPGLTYPLKHIAQGLRQSVEQMYKKVKKGTSVLSFCLGFRDPVVARFFLDHMASVARYSPGNMFHILECVKKNLTLPWTLFSSWFTRGTDLITSNRVDEGVRFLLMRSKESRWLLGIHNVVLDDLKNVLKIYCASLAGREMIIAGLDISGFQYAAPYTDGKTIFLPQEINFFNMPRYNERTYTVIAAQQAASIRMKTFAFDLSKITFADELHTRYGTLLPGIMENVRKQYGNNAERIRERPDGEIEITFKGGRKLVVLNTDHEKFYYSFPTPEFLRDLFILCENKRIEYLLSLSYAGLKEDFKLVNHYLFKNRPPVSPPGNDRQKQFLGAVECLIQFSLGGTYKGSINNSRIEQVITELCSTLKMIENEQSSVHDTAHICFLLYNLFYDNFPIVTYFTGNNLKESFSSLLQPELHPEAVLDMSPDLLKDEYTSRPAPAEDEKEEGEEEKIKKIDLSSLRNSEKNENYVQDLITKGELRIFRYPEYNMMKNSYEDNHCTLFERTPESLSTDYYNNVLKQYRVEYKKIKKRFLLMKPEEVEISRRWDSGEEIHMTDAFDYMVDLSRDITPDEKIYVRKIQNKRDIVVAILVDTSSSTMEPIYMEKRIIDVEKEALCLLASVLHIIGDTFGIFSFFSMGRNRVFYNIIKDFHEEWHQGTQGRIPRITGKASNRDGCAIRHTVSRLLTLPHKTKLFILLSDGIPADLNYGSTSSNETNDYAIEDTRRAIIEARRGGIIPYCITIDHRAKHYIPHLYGDFNYVIIDDIIQLPQKLTKLYIKLTK